MIVSLRPMKHADITDEYLKWFRDPEVTRYLECGEITYQQAMEYLSENQYGMYAIKVENRHIGNVKIGPINKKHNFAQFSIVIGNRSFWNQGCGTQAIRKGSLIAFEKHSIRKLVAGIYSNNSRAICAFVKAGWLIEACLGLQRIFEGGYVGEVRLACHSKEVK